jgi:hypothetical protein
MRQFAAHMLILAGEHDPFFAWQATLDGAQNPPQRSGRSAGPA